MRRAIIALGLLLAWGRGASALDPALDVSQYAHTSWKVRDGFVKGRVTSIAQTPDGYVWLGTELALYRFDGVRAVPCQQFSRNYIRGLLVARDGTLWIATLKGLASWKDGKVTQYSEVAGQNVLPLLQDRDGTVWFGVSGPGKLCAVQGGKVHCYGAESFGQGVDALYEDHNGNLWVAATTGLWRWAPSAPQHYAFPQAVLSATALIEDDTNTMLLATNDGLKQLVNGKIQDYVVAEIIGRFSPQTVFRSREGDLWIGAHQGLLRLHMGRTDVFGVADGLSDEGVDAILEDREGNVWVTTQGGLDRFRDYVFPRISTSQGLSSSEACCVQATSDGAIWVATANALNRWDNGKVSVYGTPQRALQGKISREAKPWAIDNPPTVNASSGLAGTPHALGLDDQGQVWVFTNKGLFYFEDGQFKRLPSAPGGNVWSITGDGHGSVWIRDGFAGLVHFARGGPYRPIPWAQVGRKSGYGARALLVDRSGGGVWLGFYEGGVSYFKDDAVRDSYTSSDGLGTGRVNDLRFDLHGALWVGTEGGLSRIKDGHIATLTSRNGLPCDEVHWSIEDDDHFVWFYMPCGLVRMARPELDAWTGDPKHIVRATLFDASDGVPSLPVYGSNSQHVTKAPDGKIWFVAYDGVSVIDPRHLAVNKLPPPVHIEQVTADRKTYWENSYGDTDSSPPRLPPLVRDLTIDYTALSLVVPEKVRFRVKLEGWDRDWKDAGNERKAFYSNLPPRKYRFRVTACNNSGVWNEAGTFLDFSIAPAYWQTNWFRALCVAAFMAILWAVYRLRVGVLEERQALLERQQALSERHEGEVSALNQRLMKAQEEERIRIAGELHDGVLQQLTSLALQLGTATLALPPDSEPKAEVSEVEKKLIQVGAEIRQLSHELHPAALHEKGLPDALSSYCEEFSATRGIPISYQADESVEDLSPGAALCIYRIAQEALGNVAKHARAKQVQVRLTRTDDGRVCLSVSDDGIGFNPDGSGKSGGLGLINMRERVRQLNGTFEFESEPGRGTTVKAEVPFRPAS